MMKDIYILSNLINNTTDINSPLKNTQRVKYTCFDVSKSYIVFGASSGSLYIFQRKPCKFLQLIPNKYRTIKNLSISPNERFIAFTTQKGIISVLVINISSAASSSSSSISAPAGTVTTNSLPQLITANINVNSSGDDDYNNGDDIINRTISASKQSTTAAAASSSSSSSSSATLTATTSTASSQLIGLSNNNLNNNGCLYWSSDEKQFYYGNNKGEVYLITLTLFVGKTLIDISVHPILYLDTPIVQISEYESLLLVSNYTKCILCNMDYEEYKQIGNQPRDGLYGGCFSILDKNNYQTARIYCTRPGYRIWEINLEGNVLKTHEYKLAIGCQPTKIFNNNDDKDNEQNHQMVMMNERNDLYKKNNENIIHNKDDDDDDDNNDDNNDEKCEKYENLENDPNNDDKSNNQLQNNLQFTKLYTINNDKFIITYNNNGLYIIDPRDQSLILWTNKFKNIQYCNIINNNEIYIFTANGHLYNIQLETLQMFVINLIKNKNHMNLCIKLLKKNLKYFSEKAKEDYNLLILDNIKKYLIDNNQYDILNDLSVIFDCIQNIKHNPNIILNNIHKTKHNLLNNKRIMKNKKRITVTGTGNNENDNVADDLNNDDDDDDRNSTNSTHSNTTTNSSCNSSSGSSGSNSSNSSSGVYILENSFCDNLKINKHNTSSPSSASSSIFKSSKLTASATADKHLKDMLLTVTGKFGKNIIKYKFNIFNDEQKSLVVEDLLPNVKSKNFNNITSLNATTTIKNDTVYNIGMLNKNQKQNLPQTSIYQEFNKNEKDKIIYENHHNTDNKRQQNECNNDDDGDDDDDDKICDHVIVKKNSLKLVEEKIITEEEKTVYDLYIIWKSSKISNLCFLDRYRKIFDRYTSKDIIKLLNKLEVVMIENESSSDTSDIDDDDDDENDLNDHKNDIDINDHIDKNIIIKDNHNHNNRNKQQHHKNLRHNNRLLKSKIYCYEIYFNYLKSELIWEIDDITRDYIKNGFILLNTININYNDNDDNDDNLKNNKNNININCFKCNYPLIFSLDCKYRNIGEELYKFYKSRNELIKCLDLIQNVPSLMNILCKYYLIKYHEYNNNDDNNTNAKYNNLINNDHNNDIDIDIDVNNIINNDNDNDDYYNNDLCKKLIKIPLYYGDIKLFMDISKYYDNKLWNYCFELFSNIQNNKLYCIECNECNIIEKKYLINYKNDFYKWNTFLDLTLNYLESDIFLSLLLKYSNLMPNNCIKKDIFIKCLLK